MIVIGHDARSSSPDLCVGVSAALRLMGCEVVDIGRVSVPCHAFAVEHLQCDAGIYVAGHGYPPRIAGLDLVGPRGIPWSLWTVESAPGAVEQSPVQERPRAGTLAGIERAFLSGVSRPTRQGGLQRYFDAVVPYQASLHKHYRNLRPLTVVCATADPAVMSTLVNVFEQLPAELIPLAVAVPWNPAAKVGEGLLRTFRATIREANAHCGVAVAEDGRGLWLLDERGTPVAIESLFARIVSERRGARHRALCYPSFDEGLGELIREAGCAASSVSGGREQLVDRMFDPAVGYGIERGGIVWMKDSVPACDAAATLGVILGALSRRGGELSRMIADR